MGLWGLIACYARRGLVDRCEAKITEMEAAGMRPSHMVTRLVEQAGLLVDTDDTTSVMTDIG